MAKSDLNKEVFKFIEEFLKVHEFKKKNQHLFYKILDTNIYGIITFGISYYGNKDKFFLSCSVGIHHSLVQKLSDELLNTKNSKLLVPTISESIGYLTPMNRYIEWEFNNFTDYTNNLIDIKDKIKKYGFPFFLGKSDINCIIKEVEEGNYIPSYKRNFILPILYYCNDNKIKGTKFIKDNYSDDELYQEFIKKYNYL